MNRAILSGLVLLILSFPELKAGSDFRDGYIITLSKDTIFGKIDYRSELNNSISCLFRNGSETKEYKPDQIAAYGFVNDKYFSSQIIEGTFTEILVEGALSLYKSGYDLYVLKTGDQMHKLESIQIRDTADVRIEGGTETVIGYREDVRWKGIVTVLTSDCLESYKTLQSMSLNEKSLTHFVIGYNLCKGAPYRDFKSKKTWMHLSYGVNAGVSLSAMKFSDRDYLHDYLADSYSSNNPVFGLSFDLSSPRLNEKIALHVDMNYIKAGFKAFVTGHQALAKAYYTTGIDISTLAIPIMLRYTFSAGKSSIYLNAGAEIDANFSCSSKLNAEVVSGTTVDTYESEAIRITKNQMGYVGGIGFARAIGKMKLGTELRYFKAATVKTNTGYDYDQNRISLSLILNLK